MASPQLENGHTRIANELLERIIASGLNGTELACIFFIIRKIYGFNKKEDEISLSQFLNAIPVSKETICTALHNLQLVKILRLVKKGTSKNSSNLWAFNKDYDTWQLVKKARLVKVSRPTSQDLPPPTSQENLTYKRQYKRQLQKKRNFVPPSLSEVAEYIKHNDYNVDAEQWLNFYESKGWMVGKNKMKNWQAAVRTWAKRNGDKPTMTLEQEAKELVKQCETQYGMEDGAEIAMSRFSTKYGKDEMVKYKGIFKL